MSKPQIPKHNALKQPMPIDYVNEACKRLGIEATPDRQLRALDKYAQRSSTWEEELLTIALLELADEVYTSTKWREAVCKGETHQGFGEWVRFQIMLSDAGRGLKL